MYQNAKNYMRSSWCYLSSIDADRSNLSNSTRVRAWCPECGDRLFTVYYVNPKNKSQHVAKTNFLVCRACPRFFELSITELPLQILPSSERKRMSVYKYRTREELGRIRELGLERASAARDEKGRYVEVEAVA